MKSRLMQGTMTLAITIVGLSGPGLARAQSSSGNDDFGRHVVSCVRARGFDRAHNPGMHQGAAGWDGHECAE